MAISYFKGLISSKNVEIMACNEQFLKELMPTLVDAENAFCLIRIVLTSEVKEAIFLSMTTRHLDQMDTYMDSSRKHGV